MNPTNKPSQAEDVGVNNGNVSEELAKEINDGIDAVLKNNEDDKGSQKEEKVEKSQEDDSQKEEKNENKEDDDSQKIEKVENADKNKEEKIDKGSETKAPELSNEILERAIKAGLTLSEAREYPNESLLEKTLSRIESSSGSGSEDNKGSEKDESGEDEIDWDSLPELDAEEFDEDDKLVKGYNAMRGLLKQQSELIKSQKQSIKELQNSKTENWIDTKIATLSTDNVSAEQKTKLKQMVKVLEAGYKASGEQVSNEDVFKEASDFVLGKAEVKEKATKGKLAKRKEQHINPPSNKKIKTGSGDVLKDVAEEINNKFFK